MLEPLTNDPRLHALSECLEGRYQFLSLLGQGGSGSVYEVRNLQLNRLEALKVLSQSFPLEDISLRFIQEAKVAASLDHPRIVKIYDFGHDQGIYWYSMQLVAGPTLGDLLEAGRTLDPSSLARLAIPIMDALAYSHEQGVIHRDIKPANILFSPEGRPFLTDFGIAKTRESTVHTHTGRMMGTPAYVAPEQALGERVDARADQYALAITLYKAACGRLPFKGDAFLTTLIQRISEAPIPIQSLVPDMPPPMAEVLMRALEREREARWPSIAEMKEAILQACIAFQLDSSGPLGDLSSLRPPSQPLRLAVRTQAPSPQLLAPTADLPALPRPRRWGTWIALAAAVLVALGWGLRHPRRPPTSPALAPTPTGQPPRPEAPLPTSAPSRAVPPKPVAPQAPTPTLRRAVTYPLLLDEGSPSPGSTPTSCAGSRVTISLDVREDGTVKACRVISPAPPECASAARSLGLRYRFKPALDAEGHPIATTVAATIDFPEKP